MKPSVPLISVIIPIYMVEDYLERCINSVITQTYSNIEIILVNDGSKDGCGDICNAFQDRDERINVIHQSNGGLSDARNAGLKKATGDYIFYLDSDDWLKENCIERLVKKALEYDADIVQCNFYYTYPEHLLQDDRGFIKGEHEKLLDSKEALERLIENVEVKNFAWGKLIRSELAKQEHFPKGKLFEDTFWTHRIIAKTKTYLALKEPLLFYLQRDSSISYGKFNKRNLDRLEGMLLRYNFISKNCPDLSQPMLVKCLDAYQDMYFQALRTNEATIAQSIRDEYLKLYCQLSNGFLSNSLLIPYKVFKFSPHVFQTYKFISRVYVFIKRKLSLTTSTELTRLNRGH